jgi:hypothetical protein
MRFLIAIATLLLGMSAAFAQGAEERRYFGDWLAACRADGYCSATAYQNPNPGGGRVADYVFRVGRHAEQIYWELSFTTVATMGREGELFTVSVDDNQRDFSAANEVAPFGSVNEFYFLGEGAQQVMDWLAPGRMLGVDFVDTGGAQQRAEFSLAGLTASLIWIDEQQKRLGSERVAEAAPIGLAPVGEAASAPEGIPPELTAWLAADPECRPFAEIANGEDIEIVQLDETNRAYILPCWSAAYNFGWKVFVENSGTFSQAVFPEFSASAGWTASTFIVNYAWDDASKSLSSFYKGRGIGDCGSAGIWRWGEYAFRLTEFRSKEDCDGAEGGFPVVYSETQP